MKREEYLKFKEIEKQLKEISKIFRVREEDLPRVIERFKKEINEMEEKLGLK
ncbi:MAG: hypothetical protein J7L39_01835 [Candidatus Aenigmarchaeota archaeon]|nr:hypothetical protein [Candidatus Aenigmarchaeota archaeon]